MKLSWKIYVVLAVVALASFVAATYLPIPEIFRGIIAVPGLGALAGVVYQVLRDQWSYERQLALQRHQQDFTFGIASHMSKVLYDKHVNFCEAYISRVTEGILKLVSTGPSSDAISLASDLAAIRIKFAAWISDDLEKQLLPLENALRRIGAIDGYTDTVKDEFDRNQLVKEMYDSFGIVLGLDKPLNEEQAKSAASVIIDHLRALLGIRQLTQLRQRAAEAAMGRWQPKDS